MNSLTTYFVVFLFGGLIGFFQTFQYNTLKNPKEEYILKYLNAVEQTFDLHTIEVTGIAELKYTEKDEHLLSSLTNPLFSKEYHFFIPFQATYGINLKKIKFLNFYQSKIYVNLPNPELLTFDLQLHKKRILTNEGWLVFSRDDKFVNFEKKIYEKQKSELKSNQEFKKMALEEAKTKIKELLKPLNMPVDFSLNGFN